MKNKKSCHLSFNKHSVSFVKVIHFPYMHSYASYLKSIHYQWFVNFSFWSLNRIIYNYSLCMRSIHVFIDRMKVYRQRMKSKVDILSWVDNFVLLYIINIYCLIRVSYCFFFGSCDLRLSWHSNIDVIQKHNGSFHRLNFKKHDLSCSDRYHEFSSSSIKID